MLCPNCKNKLEEVQLKKAQVSHCQSCGCTFFDKTELDAITLDEARELAKKRTSDSISGDIKKCPRDGIVLTSFDSPSLPPSVTLLLCPHCEGVFAYPDDLVNVKRIHKRVEDKLKPPGRELNVRSIFAYAIVFALALGIVSYLSPYFQQAEPVSAVPVCDLRIAKRDNLNTIYCTTPFAMLSEAHFYHNITTETVKRSINEEPQPLHMLSVYDEDIPTSEEICVKFVFKSDKETLETPCVPFVAPE